MPSSNEKSKVLLGMSLIGAIAAGSVLLQAAIQRAESEREKRLQGKTDANPESDDEKIRLVPPSAKALASENVITAEPVTEAVSSWGEVGKRGVGLLGKGIKKLLVSSFYSRNEEAKIDAVQPPSNNRKRILPNRVYWYPKSIPGILPSEADFPVQLVGCRNERAIGFVFAFLGNPCPPHNRNPFLSVRSIARLDGWVASFFRCENVGLCEGGL